MDELLNNTCFRLVFVDENGDMSRITPANSDEKAKANVEKRGYRCVSHLWGNERDPWRDHHVAGVEHDVEIRDNNKKKCLELFMKHKGYWWMDIFCVNQVGEDETRPVDGALYIMGDIYKNCKKCYCILDGSNIISKRDLKNASFVYNNETSSEDDIFIKALDKSGIVRRIYPLLFYILGSDWVNRVWTLQECVLPNKVYFVAEYDESPMISLRDVIRLCRHLEGSYSDDYMAHISGLDVDEIPGYTQKFHDRYINGINVLRYITKTASEYTNFQYIRKLHRKNTKKSTLEIIDQLYHSKRLATKKLDYVYGVAGLLGIVVEGNTMDEIYDSMIAGLWSKDIFMSKEYYVHQISDSEDQDEGLSRAFAREIHQGILVIRNKSRLKPKSMSKHSFGNIIRHINIGNGFDDTSQDKFVCSVKGCEPSWQFPEHLCVKCRKIYKDKFGIMVTVSNKRVRMDAAEVAYLLSDDAHHRSLWSRCNFINTFRLKNVYVTDKYLVALSTEHEYHVGEDMTIPLHGKFRNLYMEKTNIGYEVATVVSIDRHGNKTSVGCVYCR